MVSKFSEHDSRRFIPARTADFQSVSACVCVCGVEVSCTLQPRVECGINGKVTQRLELGEWGGGGVEGGRRGGFEMRA